MGRDVKSLGDSVPCIFNLLMVVHLDFAFALRFAFLCFHHLPLSPLRYPLVMIAKPLLIGQNCNAGSILSKVTQYLAKS